MTDDPIEKLHAAVQEFVRTVEEDDLVLIDFAIGYAATSIRTADQSNFIGSASYGPRHAAVGLAHMLIDDLTGDDE